MSDVFWDKGRSEMGNKKVTNTAKFLYRLCIVGLFAIVWFSLYNNYTFETYRIRGGLVSVLIFYVIYSWLCNVYSAYRVASSSIGDIIFKQFVSFSVADFVLYMECCLIYNQYVNIIPGVITVFLQLISTVLITFFTKRHFMKSVEPKKTLVIYGKNIPKENALQFEKRLLLKYSHLFRIVSTESAEIDANVLDQYMKVTDSVILYQVEDNERGRFVAACMRSHKNFYYTPEIDDILATGSSVRHLLDTPLMKYDYQYEDRLFLFEKRVMDIVLSLLFIIILSPVMLITAVCIKFEDGGPVFFRQKRHTKNMKEFEILKFRSMKTDAERYGAIPATQDDPRITKVGRIIRKVRIDELPQFFNILKGDMSFVGPRPERIEHTEMYCRDLPEFTYRLRVKGGLTGYAQIFGKYNTSAHDKLLLDLMYIEDQSILNDIKLILLTIRTVFEMESTEGFDEVDSERMNKIMAEQGDMHDEIMESAKIEAIGKEDEAEVEKVVENIAEEKNRRDKESEMRDPSSGDYWLDGQEDLTDEENGESGSSLKEDKKNDRKKDKKAGKNKKKKSKKKKDTAHQEEEASGSADVTPSADGISQPEREMKEQMEDQETPSENQTIQTENGEAKDKDDTSKPEAGKEKKEETSEQSKAGEEKENEDKNEYSGPEVDIADILREIEAIQSEAYMTGRTAGRFKTGLDRKRLDGDSDDTAQKPIVRFDKEEKEFKNVEAEEKARREEIRRNAIKGENLTGVASFIKKNLTEEANGAKIAARKKQDERIALEAAEKEEREKERAELEDEFDEIAMGAGALNKAVGKARTAVENSEKARAEEELRRTKGNDTAEGQPSSPADGSGQKHKKDAAGTSESGRVGMPDKREFMEQPGVVQKMNLSELADLIRVQEARATDDAPEFTIPERPEKPKDVFPVNDQTPEHPEEPKDALSGNDQTPEHPEEPEETLSDSGQIPEISEEARRMLREFYENTDIKFEEEDEETGPRPVFMEFDEEDEESAGPRPIMMEPEETETQDAAKNDEDAPADRKEPKHLIDIEPDEETPESMPQESPETAENAGSQEEAETQEREADAEDGGNPDNGISAGPDGKSLENSRTEERLAQKEKFDQLQQTTSNLKFMLKNAPGENEDRKTKKQ